MSNAFEMQFEQSTAQVLIGLVVVGVVAAVLADKIGAALASAENAVKGEFTTGNWGTVGTAQDAATTWNNQAAYDNPARVQQTGTALAGMAPPPATLMGWFGSWFAPRADGNYTAPASTSQGDEPANTATSDDSW